MALCIKSEARMTAAGCRTSGATKLQESKHTVCLQSIGSSKQGGTSWMMTPEPKDGGCRRTIMSKPHLVRSCDLSCSLFVPQLTQHCVRSPPLGRKRLQLGAIRAVSLEEQSGKTGAAKIGAKAGRIPGRTEPVPNSNPSLKTCADCQRAKLLVDFEETPRTPDGVQDACRACLAARRLIRLGRELHHLALPIEEAWERAKTCRRCNVTKELRDFPLGSKKGTLSCYCRHCKCGEGRARQAKVPSDTPQCCKRCNVVKPASDFYRNSKSRSGLVSKCIVCMSVERKENYEKYRTSGNYVPRARKVCGPCGEGKDRTEFFERRSTGDGLTGSCKPCHRAAHKSATAEYRRKKREERAAKELLDPKTRFEDLARLRDC